MDIIDTIEYLNPKILMPLNNPFHLTIIQLK